MTDPSDPSLGFEPLDEELGDGAEEPIPDMADVSGGLDEAVDLKTGAWHTVGAGLDADIVVTSGQMSARGVRMRRVGFRVEIQKVADGVQIEIDGALSQGGVVSLVDQEVVVDGVRITDQMVPQDTLDLAELPDFFAPILIGRSPDCDYVLTDDSVSARHAGLSRQDGYLLLEDLDSANGTYVSDRRIKRVRISWRTEFEIGGHVLTPVQVVQAVRVQRMAGSTSVLNVLQEGGLGSRKTTLGPDTGVEAPPTGVVRVDSDQGDTLVVGRDPKADIVLDTPNVSRLHARLERVQDGFRVEDLGSTNGTWVNGERIRGPTLVRPGDDLRFGPQRLNLTGDGQVETRKLVGGVTGVRLDAAKLIREVGSKKRTFRIVDGVSFSILPGEMVAIMGPSGAGKTSVLTTIAGYTPPSSGNVFMDGMSLYRHYDVFRSAIGYVPQEDVMHRTLTVEEVLFYQAKLNFPAEVRDDEIRDRITTVLRQLDLEGVRDSLVGDEVRRGLSGGQRKRLNVAMELLSEPSVLLLDEPTSGLDARSAMQLIRQCRGLASAGRTVIMTIHQPRREAFDLFDKLLLLTKGGKLAYFGPAREAKRFFTERSEVPPETARNPADYVLDVLDPLDPDRAQEPAHWRKAFKESPLHERFVRSRLRKEDRAIERKAAGRSRKRKANPLRQLITLTRRYALLKWRDRGALAVQLAQAPVIGGLAVLLFHEGRFKSVIDDDITPALFVVMAAAVWFGCSNVAREIVGEKAVFRRERYRNLRPGPYLLSKLLVQGLLVAVQLGLLLAILVPTLPLKGGVVALGGVTLLAGLAAMSMGILVSTIARTPLQAIQLVPLVILPQIMLSGVLMPVGPPLKEHMEKKVPVPVPGEVIDEGKPQAPVRPVRHYYMVRDEEADRSTPNLLAQPILLRWAYSASLNVELREGTERGNKTHASYFKAYWRHVGFRHDELLLDLLVMLGIGVGCAIGSWVLLIRRDRR